MSIKPINGHVLIKPVEERSAFASSMQSFEEKGEVVSLEEDVATTVLQKTISVGDTVFFDSWTASKYKDSEGSIFWLVPFDHIKAVEK